MTPVIPAIVKADCLVESMPGIRIVYSMPTPCFAVAEKSLAMSLVYREFDLAGPVTTLFVTVSSLSEASRLAARRRPSTVASQN